MDEQFLRQLQETDGSMGGGIEGGKRGRFYVTPDKRLILKGVEKAEMYAFMKFAKHYFDYVESCDEESPTTLVSLIGAFCITDNSKKKHSWSAGPASSYLVLMENLFPNRELYRVFDLKGCNYGRASDGDTGYERNLLDMLHGGSLHLETSSRHG